MGHPSEAFLQMFVVLDSYPNFFFINYYIINLAALIIPTVLRCSCGSDVILCFAVDLYISSFNDLPLYE